MARRRQGTAALMALVAGCALALEARAGDDLKNIGIGTGIGILSQIVQGKPVTLESAVGSALGAGLGSQIGGGSGSAVASAVGGIVGDTALQHVKGVMSGGQTGPQAATGGRLAQVAGGGTAGQVSLAVHTEIALEQGPEGPRACEGAQAARQCFPVTVRNATPLILSDGQGVYSCIGGGGRLDCTRLR